MYRVSRCCGLGWVFVVVCVCFWIWLCGELDFWFCIIGLGCLLVLDFGFGLV